MSGRGWRGYISSRIAVPQRVQNLVIRDYATRHELLFLLSAVEYNMSGSTMMLRAVLEDAARLEGMIFYSTHLLPSDPETRGRLYTAFLERGGAIRFALEELIIADETGIAVIEDLIMARAISTDHLPATLFQEAL